jgi:hypothetical protein
MVANFAPHLFEFQACLLRLVHLKQSDCEGESGPLHQRRIKFKGCTKLVHSIVIAIVLERVIALAEMRFRAVAKAGFRRIGGLAVD